MLDQYQGHEPVAGNITGGSEANLRHKSPPRSVKWGRTPRKPPGATGSYLGYWFSNITSNKHLQSIYHLGSTGHSRHIIANQRHCKDGSRRATHGSTSQPRKRFPLHTPQPHPPQRRPIHNLLHAPLLAAPISPPRHALNSLQDIHPPHSSPLQWRGGSTCLSRCARPRFRRFAWP